MHRSPPLMALKSLAEIALQQTGQGLAVAGFVAGHLVDGLLFAGLAGRS